ncbi:MAG: glycosyltransferase [Wolinella sp.]
MKKPEIIVIIATKDRVGFLEQSLKCVKNHSHEPNYLVVTSDSQDKNTQNRERELCEEFGAKFIQNRRTKECYAGNLNSAIDHILSHYAFNLHRERSPEACFVAFLDDDDLWQADYLQSCVNALQDDTDFVVSGLIYKKNGKSEKLDIPKKLGVKSFLTKNPHIQGSNTFIRLSTLLKAGCFDENLRSMTDRDLFTRVMMLNPKYTILNEHLVEIDASKSRKRLTTDLDKKRESMAKFYAKYGGLMDKREEGQFFANAKERFGIKLDKKAIVKILADKPFEYKKEANCKINDRVIFAFVTGEEEYARRIIKNIKEQPLTHKKIVCVDNTGVKAAQKLLKDSAIPASVLNNDEIEKLSKRCKDEGLHFVDHELFKNGKIRSIAHARSLLHLFAYLESEDGDVIWILDDDMEFAQNYLIDGKPTQIPLDISRVIAHCKKEQYDVMIGSYSKDAPLPTLSTLRCSLLDCLYATKLSKNALMDQKLWRKRDYYYGLSMESFNHLESPFVAYEKPKLDDIFSGKATTRELFSKPFEVSKDLYSRGGNTLVFNRKTLEVPNISPTINGQSMRRSDYFWVCQLKNLNYKVVSSTFSTLHNRKTEEIFDYYKESQKLLFDLVGSAFTHKYKQDDTREEFYKNFQEAYFNRLVLIIADYYRIMGIREILGLKDERLESFNLENLHKFIKQAKEIAEESSTKVSFSHIHSKVKLYQHYLHNVSQYRELLNATFRCGELEFLGIGEEGIVFNDGEMVYKVFHETLNKETCKLLEYFNNCIDENKGFFKFKIKSLEKRTIIYYKAPNLKNCQKYVGGHALEVASMLAFLRSKGLILKNIKKENFIIIDHQLKFIDYGKDIEYFSIDLFQKSIERAYQMLKFSNLNALEFKILIKRTYQGDHNFNFGIENFLPLLSETYKEQTHDPIIIELIRQLRPDRLLDYGAGKCKIANALSCEMEVFVFDVNAEQVKERANKSLKIVENIKNINEKFNLINCNLVLCCVEQKTVEDILGKIYNLLNDDGYLILSICNPFFDDINQSQTRICGYHDDYSICSEYTKKTNFINRIEYHRPFAFYENKLKQYGFELLEIREDCGVEIESLEGISEHLILVCKKRERVVLEDCSLLIKTNSMDHESVYKSVVHIFEQLEKDSRFSERIVVVDSEKEERSRAYTSNNRESLLGELRKLKNEGYIDRIIEAQEQNNAIYQRFFACDSHFAHAKNSQPLLATLTGIAAVQTRYVFQTDLDILYFNHAKNSVQNAFDMLKKYNATTLSLSICHSTSTKPLMGTRVEVRSCFMDTQKLNALLPLRNPTENGIFTLPWHRALDRMLAHEDSLRLHQNGLFFIHPQNQLKNGNLISVARTALERGYFPDIQQNKVDLAGDLGEWTQKSYASMIIFIRGKDTPPKKLRRLFNSLKM